MNSSSWFCLLLLGLFLSHKETGITVGQPSSTAHGGDYLRSDKTSSQSMPVRPAFSGWHPVGAPTPVIFITTGQGAFRKPRFTYEGPEIQRGQLTS